MQLLKIIHDLLFPIKCLGCGKFQEFVCSFCFEKIELKKGFECAFCSSRTLNGEICPFCRNDSWLDYFWTAADYSNPLVKKMLWAYKYKFVRELRTPLSRLLLKFLEEKEKNKFVENHAGQLLLVPMPIHRLRLNWRSYNQSELIAQELAEKIKLEIAADVLLRVKNKKPQAEIKNKEERSANIEGIFYCPTPERVNNKIILLVDDVATTGSTLNQAAKTLRQAGALKVIGLVVAKG